MNRKSVRLTELLVAYSRISNTEYAVTVSIQSIDDKTLLSFMIADKDMLQLTIQAGIIISAMQSLYGQTDLLPCLRMAMAIDQSGCDMMDKIWELAAGKKIEVDLLEGDAVMITTLYAATPDMALVLDALLNAQKGIPLSLRTLLNAGHSPGHATQLSLPTWP